MPKYIVKEGPILHGKEGEKEAKLYGPEDIIELTEKEAEALGSHVEPAPRGKKAEE